MSQPEVDVPGCFVDLITTRGTEIDRSATISLHAVLRYFEHARWEVMQREALGLNALIDQGHFFVVREQTVEMRHRLGQGQRLALTTRFLDVGRSTATVLHEAIRLSDGVVMARARVVGVWLGPSRRPVRIPDTFREAGRLAGCTTSDLDGGEDAGRFETLNGVQGSFTHPPELRFTPLSLHVSAFPLPETDLGSAEHALTVPYRDLDVFSHVNAATFLGYCDDARETLANSGLLPPELMRGYVQRVSLFYQREACVGDTLTLKVRVLGPHTLHIACMRQDELLVAARLDLVAGFDAVSKPIDSRL